MALAARATALWLINSTDECGVFEISGQWRRSGRCLPYLRDDVSTVTLSGWLRVLVVIGEVGSEVFMESGGVHTLEW